MVAAFRSRNGASRSCLELALRGEHIALISVPLILEYEAVLTRPEQLQAIGLDEVLNRRFLDGLCSVAEHVEIASIWRPLLRDPNDEMVLETAVFGRADQLLTFNVRDYTGAERFGINVTRPGDAWGKAKGYKS